MKKIICSPLVKNINKGTDKLATNDESDEYLDKRKTNSQDIQNIKPKIKFILKRIPTYVATPFPPLNLSQIGNTCPKNTLKEDI